MEVQEEGLYFIYGDEPPYFVPRFLLSSFNFGFLKTSIEFVNNIDTKIMTIKFSENNQVSFFYSPDITILQGRDQNYYIYIRDVQLCQLLPNTLANPYQVSFSSRDRQSEQNPLLISELKQIDRQFNIKCFYIKRGPLTVLTPGPALDLNQPPPPPQAGPGPASQVSQGSGVDADVEFTVASGSSSQSSQGQESVSSSGSVTFDEPQVPVLIPVAHWKENPDLALIEGPLQYFVRPLNQWKNVVLIDPRVGSLPNNLIVYDAADFNRNYAVDNFSKFKGLPPIHLTTKFSRILKESFVANLSTSGHRQSDIILKYLSQISQTFHTPKYYAPMCSVCQSSGFGKSKSVSECRKRFAAVYGIFRKDTDTGHPVQPKWINTFYTYITTSNEDDFPISTTASCNLYNVGRVLIYFEGLLIAVLRWIKNIIFPEDLSVNLNIIDQATPEQLKIAYDYINLSFRSGENLEMFELFLRLNESPRSPEDVSNSIDVLANRFQLLNRRVCALVDRVEGRAESLIPEIADHPFLLILDEASVLIELDSGMRLDALTIIRRAAHWLKPSTNFLIITIGTNSDVASFHKEVQNDSLRDITRRHLLPPLILSSNWDVFREESQLHTLEVDGDLIRNFKTMLLLFTFGRPLWSSLQIVAEFDVVLTKLQNGGANPELSLMAIWGIRSGLTVNANLLLARKLLKSYMAILLYVSLNSEEMYVSYSSEPTLAIVARKILTPVKEVELFTALLHYCQRMPIDTGRVTEAVFAEFILKAVDKSVPIELTHPDGYTPNGNEFVERIFEVKEFILEVQRPEIPVVVQSPEALKTQVDSLDLCLKEHYHVTTVDSFLRSMFGAEYDNMRDLIPARILGGLVNCSQFIQLFNHFPYTDCFPGADPAITHMELPPAADILSCNVIDKELLRMGILRQVGYTMPSNYYGIDFIIPVLLEIDVKEDVEEAEPEDKDNKKDKDNTNEEDEDESDDLRGKDTVVLDKVVEAIAKPNPLKKTIFTFIAIQSKAGKDNIVTVMNKMEARLHYVRDPNVAFVPPPVVKPSNKRGRPKNTKAKLEEKAKKASESNQPGKNELRCVVGQDDLDEIFGNQLTIFLSAEDTVRTVRNRSYCIEPGTKHRNNPLASVFPDIRDGFNFGYRIRAQKTPFLEKSTEAKRFAMLNLNENLSVCRMHWDGIHGSGPREQTCIWSRNLNTFRDLMTLPVLSIAQRIIRYDHSLFDYCEGVQVKSVHNAVIHSQYSLYPAADPDHREFRNQPKLPIPLQNFDHLNNDTVQEAIRQNLILNPPNDAHLSGQPKVRN